MKVARAAVSRGLSAWNALGLTARFAVTASIVITVCMVLLGLLVNDRIRRGVIDNAAANAALYLVSFVEPHVQDLAVRPELSQSSRDKLDEILASSMLKAKRIVAIKVWARDGILAYSSGMAQVGQRFPIGSALQRAYAGSLASEYNDLDDEESRQEQKLGKPMFEVYAPVRRLGSDTVIAVVEIYESVEALEQQLRRTGIDTAVAIAIFSLTLIGSLLHIVRQGSHTINVQQMALSLRISELSRLLDSNRQLQQRVSEANLRAAEGNERLLRQVGAELHDGPVQLISLGLLRLDVLKPDAQLSNADNRAAVYDTVHWAFFDALAEIRTICAGMAIPELKDCTLAEAIALAAEHHQRRTGTSVDLQIGTLPENLATSLSTSLYRFVQEGLNNAYRHAEGRGQKVEARCHSGELYVAVSDRGGGFSSISGTTTPSSGLGLTGMRDRILALGGEFDVVSTSSGTTISARFEMEQLV